MGEIKVIVTDDSGLMRLIIADIINEADDMKVVDTAFDGKDCVEKALKQEVDVIVLDMTMGEYDGLYAIKNILEKKKVPILILSAMGNTNMDPIMEALKLGAIDYLNKPEKNRAKVREISAQIIKKVREVAKSNRITIAPVKEVKANTLNHTFDSPLSYDLIAIGASTGGPTAVEAVVSKLPGNLPVPVIIAQHMPANFIPSYAKRLDNISPLEVLIGRKDDRVEAGKIVIASGSRNTFLRRNELGHVVIDFTQEKYKEFNYPSIDCLMLSVAEVYGARSIAAILTGMGKDGALGMEAIYRKGGYTLAQDEATSVVYGMPRAIKERGLSKADLPISQMAGFMVSCLS
ncbi:MAG: chemotaxis-specific protein-glutamate methyltransferase CheB [Luteibaculum sp.]